MFADGRDRAAMHEQRAFSSPGLSPNVSETRYGAWPEPFASQNSFSSCLARFCSAPLSAICVPLVSSLASEMKARSSASDILARQA